MTMNVQTPSNALVAAAEVAPTRKDARVVSNPIPILDTAQFEHMQRIAVAMSSGSLVPDALCKIKVGNQYQDLPPNTVVSNCFMVVNQAVRWGMDPFAVAQSVSIVKGKLCYEGKLIAAVIKAKVGIRLLPVYSGEARTENRGVKIIGRFPDEDKDREIEGTVKDWATHNDNSPWKPPTYDDMLFYRGCRQWARRHSPDVMLGVYTPDEMEELTDSSRAQRARDVTPGRQLTHQPDDGPPDPEKVEGERKPRATDKPAEDPDIARVEAGRDDGKPVVWEDGPPDPDTVEGDDKPAPAQDDDIPLDLDRSAAAPFLRQIADLCTYKELVHWIGASTDKRKALEEKDQRRVQTAIDGFKERKPS